MSESDEDVAFASADEEESGADTKQSTAEADADSGDNGDVAKDFEFLSMTDEKLPGNTPEKPAESDTKADTKEETKEETMEETKVGAEAEAVADTAGATGTPEPEDKSDSAAEPTPGGASVLGKLSDAANSAKQNTGWAWGGISNWGTNVIHTATSSVQTFADSVGEGLHVVFDPLDAEAETMAQADKVQMKAAQTPDSPADRPSSERDAPILAQPEGGGGGTAQPHTEGAEGAEGTDTGQKEAGWFPGWGISGITNVVKKTMKDTSEVFKEQSKTIVSGSKSLVSGSLDVLESIGKKTYDVIAEGDHGIKSTIKKSKEKTNLSQLLREAKERAEHNAKEEEEFAETRKAHFGAQFDEFQGLVQLEALEMLSNQCEGRVQAMLTPVKGDQLDSIKKQLVTIRRSFQLEDMEEEEDEEKDHEFDRLLSDYVGQVGLNTTPERLIHVQEKCRKYLMDCQTDIDDDHTREPKAVHEAAIQALAEFTARCIEHYHRVGQLILLDKSAPLSSYKTKATSLASATRVLCTEVGIFSVKFTQCLSKLANKSDEPGSVNPMITNVYLEASNSSTYIQDAFLLLLPVVQQGAIEAHKRETLES